jgi:hypothetical protein
MTVFVLVFERLLRRAPVPLGIQLVYNHSLQGRLAIDDGNHQKENYSYDMRQRFFQKRRVHITG